jgi:broad specificity phosphatase PhoE
MQKIAERGIKAEDEVWVLILVRHSLPAIDPEVPSATWPLSAEGRERCVTLAKRLAEYDLNVIVTSSESKATETGQIVADILGVPCESAPNLHEHERPFVAFGATEQFIERVTRLFETPADLIMGSETADQAHSRVAHAVSDVIEQHPTGNLAIISHGTVMTLFIARAAGLDPVPFWRRLGLPAYALPSLPTCRLLEVRESV